MSHLVTPHLTFPGLEKRLNHFFSQNPVTAVDLLNSGATGLVTTDSSAPVSTIKSVSWSPIFKVTMGSQGPDVFEPQHPYSVSMLVSSATRRGLFSLLLGTLSSNDRTHSIGHIDLAVMEPVAFIGTRWRAVLTLNLEGVSLL